MTQILMFLVVIKTCPILLVNVDYNMYKNCMLYTTEFLLGRDLFGTLGFAEINSDSFNALFVLSIDGKELSIPLDEL